MAATVDIGGRRVRAYSVHLETMLRMSARERADQVRGLRPVVPGGASVEDERGASDHRPVWALARFE